MACATKWISNGKLAKELCLALKIDKLVTSMGINLEASGKVVVDLQFVLDADDTNYLMTALQKHRESNPE